MSNMRRWYYDEKWALIGSEPIYSEAVEEERISPQAEWFSARSRAKYFFDSPAESVLCVDALGPHFDPLPYAGGQPRLDPQFGDWLAIFESGEVTQTAEFPTGVLQGCIDAILIGEVEEL